jgi:O-antigen ligase
MERTAATGDMLVYTHFHNFLLDAWVRAGLIGVAALLMLLLVPLLIAVRARRDAVGNAGLAMMAVLVLTYAVSGMTNIMLGHDILDSLFIYGMITATFLIFGADRGTVAPAPPKPAPADPDAAGRTAGSIAP